MYTFGGQKGQQIIVSEQQQIAELQKIKTLAQICVNVMKKAKGITIIETKKQQSQQSVPKMMMPPPTMKNKTLQQRKKALPNLNFINEQQQQREQQQREQPIMKLNIEKNQNQNYWYSKRNNNHPQTTNRLQATQKDTQQFPQVLTIVHHLLKTIQSPYTTVYYNAVQVQVSRRPSFNTVVFKFHQLCVYFLNGYHRPIYKRNS